MLEQFAAWWHAWWRGHTLEERRASPGFDPGARGIVWRCQQCPDRVWAR